MSQYFLGKRLKHMRKNMHISQEDFAKRIGVSRQAIKNAELGKTGFPNPIFLESVSNYLNISPELVLGQSLYWNYYSKNDGFDWTRKHCNVEISNIDQADFCPSVSYLVNDSNFIELAFAIHTAKRLLTNWQLIESMVVLKYNAGFELEVYHNDDVSFADDNELIFPYSDPYHPICCYFSSVRKSHNPTKVILTCVIDNSCYSPHYNSREDLQKITKIIIDSYSSKLEIKDKFNIKINYLMNSENCNDKYDLMKEYNLTEKPNKDGFALVFYHYKNGEFHVIDGEFYFE